MSDKAKYILLGSIALVVLIICIIFCIVIPKTSVREVVLVNDTASGSGRLIANKSEGLKGAEVKKFTYKPDMPKDYKEPEEVIKEDPVVVLPNDKGISSVELDARPAEPLELVEPKKVNREEEEDKRQVRPKPNVTTKDLTELKEELDIAEKERNQGRHKIRDSIALFSTLGTNKGEINTVTKKGAIVFPFEISDGHVRFEYIAQFNNLYAKYKDEINFVFLNTSLEMGDSALRIKEVFAQYGIPTDYPLYYENYKNFSTELKVDGFDSTKGYALINNDGYICYISSLSEGTTGLEKRIQDLRDEIRETKAEDEKIIRSYCDRKGMNFTEIIKLNIGVNLDY